MSGRLKLVGTAILGVAQCGIAVANTDLLDDPTSTWEVLLSAARYESDSMNGIVNYKVIQVSPGTGPQGVETVEFYLYNAETGRFDLLTPPEVQQLQTAAANKATTGLDKEAFAKALEDSARGALVFGGWLESKIASFGVNNSTGMRLVQSMVGRDPLPRQHNPETDADNACAVAQELNNAKHQSRGGMTPGAALSPLVMMTEMSCFLQVGAEIMRADYDRSGQAALAENPDVQAAIDDIEFGGRTEYNGEPTYLLTMDDLGISEPTDDDGTININAVKTWIGATHYKQVAVIWSGTWEQDEETRDIEFGRVNSDFRPVPGTRMIHPYASKSIMSGFLNDEQQKQIKEAARQLDDYERQLAAMPADQRRLMQQMMGSQLETIRAMANSGSMEFTLLTKRVMVNTDILPGEAAHAIGNSKVLVQEIQYDLHTLGYVPGNYTGEVDKATIAAIVSFQRDYKLELTGEPTPELGRVLSATVGAID